MPNNDVAYKQLEQYYDYTKWHVGLYAAGIGGVALLREAAPTGMWCVVKVVGTFSLLLAAACAGTICGTIPECTTLEELNKKPITILQIEAKENSRWWTGRTVRRVEKISFWAGALSLVAFILFAPPPTNKPLTICCTKNENQCTCASKPGQPPVCAATHAPESHMPNQSDAFDDFSIQ